MPTETFVGFFRVLFLLPARDRVFYAPVALSGLCRPVGLSGLYPQGDPADLIPYFPAGLVPYYLVVARE